MRGMGRKGHAFLPARQHDGGIAKLDMLRGQRDGTQARTADLVQRPRGAFHRQARVDMRLTRRVLALRGGQDLTQDRLAHLGLVDPGAFDDACKNRGAQGMRGRIGERAVETPHGRAAGSYDYDIGHLHDPPERR